MSTELNTNISANIAPPTEGIKPIFPKNLSVNTLQTNLTAANQVSEQEQTVKPMNRGKELPSQSEVNGVEPQNEKDNSNDESVLSAVEDLNNYVQTIGRQLKFNVDDETGRLVVSVLDSETQKLIRQIPSEEIMTIARNLQADDKDKVSLFNAQV